MQKDDSVYEQLSLLVIRYCQLCNLVPDDLPRTIEDYVNLGFDAQAGLPAETIGLALYDVIVPLIIAKIESDLDTPTWLLETRKIDRVGN